MLNKIELRGCAPMPLIHYLKALGILRLVAEQLDRTARGSWQGDAFVLETANTKDEIVGFFLEKYTPTPLVSPWNMGSGFHAKEGASESGKKVKFFQTIKRSTNSRLEDYRNVIAKAEDFLAKSMTPQIAALSSTKKSEVLKPILVPLLRNSFSDEYGAWLDAACVNFQDDELGFPPLMGSAGNDGNFEFSLNFMGRLSEILPTDNKPRPKSEKQLNAALFATESAPHENAAVGQFYPAGAGGANIDNAARGTSFINPWDFVLAIEGTLMLASATVRQLAAGARSKASFPFTVRNSNVGYGTATENEEIRAEMWLPIWSRSTNYKEISQIFKEGRVQFSNRRTVRTGFDFARAVAELGVDRGIDAFERYAFIKRNGDANLATPLGRFAVPEKVHLLTSLVNDEKFNNWLDTFRSSINDKTPPRFVRSLKRIETAIFNLCATGDEDYLLETLVALGQAENELANGISHREKNKFLRPLSGLKWHWAFKWFGNSEEFDIARSLAAIRGDADKLGSLRTNLEPFDEKTKGWAQNANSAVWTNASLAENLSAVLQRRSIEARQGSASHPLVAGSRFALLRSIAAFLSEDTDDAKIEDYLLGLVLIDWKRDDGGEIKPLAEPAIPASLPRAYALLKLLFLPAGRFRPNEKSAPIVIKHEPSIVPLLRANRVADAIELAARRLKSSGLIPLADKFYYDKADGARLAAALLIPIHESAVSALAKLVLREKTKNP